MNLMSIIYHTRLLMYGCVYTMSVNDEMMFWFVVTDNVIPDNGLWESQQNNRN
jgi:hypothetical protein